MMRAIVCRNGSQYVGVAFEGDDAYDRNVTREAEFLTPILIPTEISADDVLPLLNSGKRKVLKSGSDIEIGEAKVKHFKLSKG